MEDTAITSYLRLIGDVHGKHDKYVKLAREAEYSVCVGDVGFQYDLIDKLLDPTRHRLISGNHDNYTRGACTGCAGDKINAGHGGDCTVCKGRGFLFPRQCQHFLGDFGTLNIPRFGPIFYVRGAWSIDQDWRTPGVSWWEDEEMSYERLDQAVTAYEQAKPEVVISHTAPADIIPVIPFRRIFGDDIFTTRTDNALARMWEIHKPKLWVFGHFHHDWDEEVRGTRFVCLNELSVLDLPAKE